jgi:hypothetical protein
MVQYKTKGFAGNILLNFTIRFQEVEIDNKQKLNN